jgi:LPS-assembly lipoprotein
MWWHEPRPVARRFARLALTLAAAGLVAGCFEPLYGQRTLTGGPGVRDRMSAVEVVPISAIPASSDARVANEVRNALIFDLTGGSGTNSPAYQLRIQLSSNRQQVIVDITTARPEFEQYGIHASYSMVELATGKTVVDGRTFARVTYDIPGQEQRFARARGLRDAENRAAKVIADSIRSRLASYFVAGT